MDDEERFLAGALTPREGVYSLLVHNKLPLKRRGLPQPFIMVSVARESEQLSWLSLIEGLS